MDICRSHTGPIDLLLTDIVMPHLNGRDLAQQAVAIRPDLRVIYMSGYTENVKVHHGLLDADTDYLQKPFSPDTLSRKVREVLSRVRGTDAR